jgi:hypothetical protein
METEIRGPERVNVHVHVSTVDCSAVLCSAVKSVQYSTVQHSTVQRCEVGIVKYSTPHSS